MYFHLGNLHMERREYELAMQHFERAHARMRRHASQPLFVVSLVSLLTATIATYRNTLFVRYPDGSSTISAFRFESNFVKPFMQRVVGRRQANHY